MFHPSRQAGLDALAQFIPSAGAAYQAGRNYDLDSAGKGAVSQLSPYIRHRLITEPEVIRAVLSQHSQRSAEKFLQEVFWRGYWKGWLEMRPGVWDAYRAELNTTINRLHTETGLRHAFEAACNGETEIDCFNNWAQSLVKNGYIHNHARMWFASIWVFTLNLPWALGADFFMRHLLDGDPASNTLGWRWVAGLQTRGKTYLATEDNIDTFTRGRFRPASGSLAAFAVPQESPEHPEPIALPAEVAPNPSLKTGLLLHDDDMTPDHITLPVETRFALSCAAQRSPRVVSAPVQTFVEDALRATLNMQNQTDFSINQALDWVKDHALKQVVTPYAPVGPVADALTTLEQHLSAQNIPLVRHMRPYDRMCWPHATHGFFKFKKNIPDFIARLR